MTDSSIQTTFIEATQIPGIKDRLHQFIVPWIYDFHKRYYDALFTDTTTSETLARWTMRADSEIALDNTVVLICEDRLAGGFVTMPGREYVRRRENDIIDLIRQSAALRCPQLGSRVRDLLPLFRTTGINDFYLSKIGVLPEMKGRGLTQKLLDQSMIQARNQGFRRLRVDVDETNGDWCRLFAANGFQSIGRGKAPTAKTVYLNLAYEL